MRNKTLWETICDRSGRDGQAAVNVSEAIAASAVNEAIGDVEIRRFVEDGLVVRIDEQTIRLTDAGRSSCSHIHRSPISVTSPASESGDPESPDLTER